MSQHITVWIDTACSLGMCAERNVIANMITNGEKINIKQIALSVQNRASKFIVERDYLAGVAAPASLLTHRVRGCNEIYHLK